LTIIFLTGISISAVSQSFDLKSPSGIILIRFSVDDSISYRLYIKNKEYVSASYVSLSLPVKVLGKKSHISKMSTRSVNDIIVALVPQRRKNIPDIFNELTITFREGFSITFRAYDDAVAWRFSTTLKNEITVINEQAEFNFTSDHEIYAPFNTCRQEVDCYHSSYEENYTRIKLSEVEKNKLAFLPVVINAESSPRFLITESDLLDYPGMWLEKGNGYSLKGSFAGYPAEEKVFGDEYKQKLVTKRTDYIAGTSGTRNFPWRIIAIAEKDTDLLDNDIVYKLASPNKLGDVSWVKPGTATDEWIVSRNFFNVDFKTGFNTETYKYIIDFAAASHLEYAIFDAGWSDVNDLFKITPGMNMPDLIDYARQKNVGIILWCLAMTVDKQMEEAFSQFEKWGIKGVEIDFMDRDDQETVNFYEKVLRSAAAHRLMATFHGAYKDTGMGRTYPNNITREAVLGHEYNMWSDRVTPDHDVLIGYIRNFAGPMDYEGGCLNNATKEDFRIIFNNPMSQGTRIHQLAQYVVYVSPLQVVAGNFSQYLQDAEFIKIIGDIPTAWDQSVALDGVLGEFMVVARQKGADWYVGAITNWDPRDVTVDLSFLGEGKYSANIYQDGVNADKNAEDYKIVRKTFSKDDALTFHLAPGGGWVGKFIISELK
jgi:alpha-glucosidase